MHGYGPFIWKRANRRREQREGCTFLRVHRARTINDIGPWFSRRYDGRTIAGFCPVSPLLFPPAASPSLFNDALLLLSPPYLLFFPPSECRQVGVRAAVNSPAPLSALMSLLLFALLNAIRAYSVSLPPLLLDPALPRRRPFDFPAHKRGGFTHGRAHAYTRARARSSILVVTLSRSRGSATGTRTRARNTDVRVTRGIAPRGWRGA